MGPQNNFYKEKPPQITAVEPNLVPGLLPVASAKPRVSARRLARHLRSKSDVMCRKSDFEARHFCLLPERRS